MNSLVKKFKAKVTNKDNSALADGEKSDTDTKTTTKTSYGPNRLEATFKVYGLEISFN